MTKQRDLKALIRARMEKTGESYATARRAIGGEEAKSPPAAVPQPWHPLLATTIGEARVLLENALARNARLTAFGIGIGAEQGRRRVARAEGRSEKELDREFVAERAELADLLQAIASSADWIRGKALIKTYNRGRSSYGYKHDVERWIETRGGPHHYVSNGAFIAAALGLGLEAKLTSPDSPNVYFKFSRRGPRLELLESVPGMVRELPDCGGQEAT